MSGMPDDSEASGPDRKVEARGAACEPLPARLSPGPPARNGVTLIDPPHLSLSKEMQPHDDR